MILFDTSSDAERNKLREPLRTHVYCALDSSVTFEVWQQINPQLTERPCLTEDGLVCFEESTYEFARTMQAPVADMMQTGLRVDDYARGRLIDKLAKEQIKLRARLNRLIVEGLEVTKEQYSFLADLNPNSIAPPTVHQPQGGHIQQLLYTILALPPVLGDTGKPSVDRDALEKLERYPDAAPFCAILLAMRDIKKTLEDLRFDVDADGRIRTTFGIAATTTGRMASYKAASGTGRNLQNVDPLLRHIYHADKGRKYAHIDLEQAEARLVGAIEWSLFGDATYLDAAEQGDCHTNVAMMTWDHIKSREDAEQLFYRNFSYRFLCKRLQFGTNYVGSPRTLSKETTIPFKLVDDFQPLYFKAFPAHKRWHQWVAQQLATQGFLVSLMGRKRWFMGRADDNSTLREAVAYDPQNSIAELLNRGLFRLWYKSKTDPENYPIRPLLQLHDAVLIDYPEDADESVLLPRLIKTLETPIELRHGDKRRTLLVPAAAEVGFNWGHSSKENPDGLIKFDPTTRDTRRRSPEKSGDFMDQTLL